jgi:hypothetical protein
MQCMHWHTISLLLGRSPTLPFALAGVIFNFWYMIRRGAVLSLRLRPAGGSRLPT